MTPRAQREGNILSKEIEELQTRYNDIHAELISKYKAHQQLIADEKAYFEEIDRIIENNEHDNKTYQEYQKMTSDVGALFFRMLS